VISVPPAIFLVPQVSAPFMLQATVVFGSRSRLFQISRKEFPIRLEFTLRFWL
jgi:hypothetical protein